MHKKSAKQLLYSLYQISPAKISIQARQRLHLDKDYSYVYGECYMDTLAEILEAVAPKSTDIFYDLGSGGGRTVLFSSLCFKFAQCVGIEIIPELFNLAETILEQLKKSIPISPSQHDLLTENIKFINADFTCTDLKKADIIFACATCFSKNLMRSLEQHLSAEIKPGTKIITVTQSLSKKNFNLIEQKICPMEWGQAQVFFYEKIG
jgi:hypothetical protein